MFDVSTPGMLASQLITLQGDAEIANRDRPGFAYDPVTDRYVAYSGVEGGGTRDIYLDRSGNLEFDPHNPWRINSPRHSGECR